MKITLNIDPKLLEQIEAHRDDIETAVKRAARKHAENIKVGLWRDYYKVLWEAHRREYQPRRSIRIVSEEPRYIGWGIITTLHAGRKR